jgi:hypothetical protein
LNPRIRTRSAPDDPDDEAEDLYGLSGDDDAPDAVTCPHCRRDIWPDAESCPHCGEAIDARPAGQAWAGRSWWWIALALAGILAVILQSLDLLF